MPHIPVVLNNSQERGLSSDESKAFVGLRGLIAFHILVFDSVFYSKLQWNLLGSSQMPLFFIMSGFFLSYTSGAVRYARTPCCSELRDIPVVGEFQRMNAKHFYRRRAARTLPLFYACNIASIPLIWSGHGWVNIEVAPIAILLMLTCTST